jgi:hypothetical protein
MRPQADIDNALLMNQFYKYALSSAGSVWPPQNMPPKRSLNPRAVRTLQRDGRVIRCCRYSDRKFVRSICPSGLHVDQNFSPFWFDFASTEYPQRLLPHGSIRTLPSFSSVSHTPSGEFADWAAVIAGACWLGTGSDGGAVATTGAGSGLLVAGTASG